MQLATVGSYPITLGWLIAFLVLVIVIILLVIKNLDPLLAGLIGGVALSRLL